MDYQSVDSSEFVATGTTVIFKTMGNSLEGVLHYFLKGNN